MRKTRNERTAEQIVKALSDFHLDIEQVGRYVARVAPEEIFTRFQVVANQAVITKNILEVEEHNDRLF